MTLLELLEWMATAAAAVAGGIFGLRWGRLPGGVAGAVVGLYVGRRLSQVPFRLIVAKLRRDRRRATADQLWADLAVERYLYSQLSIEELARRGEPAESFRPFIRTELASADLRSQSFGEQNARRWLPDLLPARPAADRRDR